MCFDAESQSKRTGSFQASSCSCSLKFMYMWNCCNSLSLLPTVCTLAGPESISMQFDSHSGFVDFCTCTLVNSGEHLRGRCNLQVILQLGSSIPCAVMYRFDGVTAYQTDWSIAAVTLHAQGSPLQPEGNQPFNLPMASLEGQPGMTHPHTTKQLLWHLTG